MKEELDVSDEEIRDAIRMDDFLKCLQEQTAKKKKEDNLYASIVALIGGLLIALYVYAAFVQ